MQERCRFCGDKIKYCMFEYLKISIGAQKVDQAASVLCSNLKKKKQFQCDFRFYFDSLFVHFLWNNIKYNATAFVVLFKWRYCCVWTYLQNNCVSLRGLGVFPLTAVECHLTAVQAGVGRRRTVKFRAVVLFWLQFVIMHRLWKFIQAVFAPFSYLVAISAVCPFIPFNIWDGSSCCQVCFPLRK